MATDDRHIPPASAKADEEPKRTPESEFPSWYVPVGIPLESEALLSGQND